MKIPGIAFERDDTSRETQALALFCNQHRIPRRFFVSAHEVPHGWIASGSVTWSTAVLGRSVEPNYYPTFASHLLHRRVWRQPDWPTEPGIFVKPADVHKRFNGRLTAVNDAKREAGPLWCSEAITFLNEWRYYIGGGRLLAAYWYTGDEDLEPGPPELPKIDFPKGWCGTVDLGVTDRGQLALVECHPPIAVGWYGGYRDAALYAEWLSLGWEWLRSN